MAPKKQQRARKKNGRARMATMRRSLPMSNEAKLLRLIADPCEAEMAHGYALSTEGVVQRFTQYYTPAATSETAFSYYVDPTQQGSAAIGQMLGAGSGAIGTVTYAPLPGQTFIDATADAVSTLACCVEVLYTGTLTNRKGYIAVAQGNRNVLFDAINAPTNTFSQLVSLSNAVAPVPSSTVSLKWSPTVANFNGSQNSTESGGFTHSNALLVTAIGVNPNDFVVRVTVVYEYAPKVGLSMPLNRVTRVTPVGVGERITSFLDRMGTWWHNVGEAAAAASRMGNKVVYGAGQVAGFTRGVLRASEAATTLLALTG